MPIYKKDEIIAWLNEKTGDVLCVQCYENEEGFCPLETFEEEEVVMCDGCEEILSKI